MPFKLNQDCRHHIPRQRRKATNWPAYDASLRQRGSLTVWFTEEAVDAWAAEPRTTRGGQPWYSALAILTALTVRAVFRLAFRQTEGLMGSIIGLLGLTLRVPDHTTLSRRAATLEVPQPRRPSTDAGGDTEPLHLLVDSTGLKLCGPGEWLLEKHGTKTVITHPLTGTCFWCKISRLRQYRTATALKVIIAEMPVVRRVAKPFCSSLLERYWPEAEHLSNELGFAV